jgi:hypothetical protein
MKATLLSSNCGVSLIYQTDDSDVDFKDNYYWFKGRTRLFIAGFLNQPSYMKCYHILCDKYKLVYQSPLRDGQDTGPNSYFFCVFDSKAE